MDLFFDLTPKELFEYASQDIHNLDDQLNIGSPNAKFTAIRIAWCLYHLREWICPDSAKLKDKKEKPKSPEELFFVAIHKNCPEFKLLREIANRTKHGQQKSQKSISTAEFSGFYADNSFAGDSFSRLHLFANGKDILREIIGPVFKYYKENWFES